MARLRPWISGVLLLYVAVSLGYLAVDRAGLLPARASSAPVSAESPLPAARDAELIVYYFHLGERCETCITAENQSREAIQAAFPAEIRAGRIVWSVIDIDAPGNEVYRKRYKLYSPALVLADARAPESRWVNLVGIWPLTNDPQDFRQLVLDGVQEFRQAGSTGEPAQATKLPALTMLLIHGETRCARCQMIEATARRAASRFAREHPDAPPVDVREHRYDIPGGETLAEQYGLTSASAVVLVDPAQPAERFVNLTRVWLLVPDREALEAYLLREIAGFARG